MDEPTEKPARDVPCVGRQRLGYQVFSTYSRVQNQTVMLTRCNVGKATTSHRTTSTSAVGSFRERRSLPGLWPAPLRGSLRESRTNVLPRLRTPSRFSLTGSLSRARDTAELQSTLPPGLPRKTQGSTLLSTSTIWQKRSALDHQLRRPQPSVPRARTRARKLTCIVFQGEINVDQAHRGYDVTIDETGKTWYNPF